MQNIDLGEQTKSSGIVTVKKFSAEFIDESQSEEKILQQLRQMTPQGWSRQKNTTTTGMNKYLVDCADLGQTPISDYYLAVGNDDTAPSSTNTSLNNEVYRTSYTNSTDNGSSVKISTYIGSGGANGYTIKEVGYFTANSGGLMLNHSILSSYIAKDSSFALQVDVSFSFSTS